MKNDKQIEFKFNYFRYFHNFAEYLCILISSNLASYLSDNYFNYPIMTFVKSWYNGYYFCPP